MGKFSGNSQGMNIVEHPFFRDCNFFNIYVPENYKFYGNAAEMKKWQKSYEWADGLMKKLVSEESSPEDKIVLEPFAGAGVLSLIYAILGYNIVAVEKNGALVAAFVRNFRDRFFTSSYFYFSDNEKILPTIGTNESRIKIIDLDPYSSCVFQIKEAARIMKNGLLFVTAGDIYAGARFKNWTFTKKRYDVVFNGPGEDYPVKVIYEFVKKEFQKLGKSAELVDFFAFKTMCRICVKVG